MTRTFVLHPVLRSVLHSGGEETGIPRSPAQQLDEAVNLTQAINLDVVGRDTLTLQTLRPATYIGKGALERLAQQVEADEIELLVCNTSLTPVQQRNLEKELDCKVIDRTGLILEIFGARAQTHEGKLQVELAALTYQKSRLVRSWTHLERQRGGGGFTGGPGERQLEIDRRLIDTSIARVKKQLQQVRKQRNEQRKKRVSVPYPVVALVGYTNAGKSTLFNRLTKADVFATDLLFATLDPTMRAVELPQGTRIILSDTVGFISDLPTQLIAAFRATLEEVELAHLIVHVHDISSPEFQQQDEDVREVLGEIGIDSQTRPMLHVWNKADALSPDQRREAEGKAARKPEVVLTSAVSGEGVEDLLTAIEAMLTADDEENTVELPASDGAALAWLHQYGRVLGQDAEGAVIKMTVRMPTAKWNKFYQQFHKASRETTGAMD